MESRERQQTQTESERPALAERWRHTIGRISDEHGGGVRWLAALGVVECASHTTLAVARRVCVRATVMCEGAVG